MRIDALFITVVVFSLVSLSKASNSTTEFSIDCNNLHAIVINYPYKFDRGNVINLTYGDCDIDSNSTHVSGNGNGFTTTLDMFECGMADYQKDTGYGVNVTFVIGESDGDTTLTFDILTVSTYCNFQQHYTAKFNYVSKPEFHEVNATEEYMKLQTFDENFTAPVTSRHNRGGTMIYLGLTLSEPTIRERSYRPQESQYLHTPISCAIHDGHGNSYQLFHFEENSCGNDNVFFRIDYGNSMWRMQHLLFLFITEEHERPTMSTQTLMCDVRKCDRGDFDSICHNMARKCLDEKKSVDFILGAAEEAKDRLNPTSNTNIDFAAQLNAMAVNTLVPSKTGANATQGELPENNGGNPGTNDTKYQDSMHGNMTGNGNSTDVSNHITATGNGIGNSTTVGNGTGVEQEGGGNETQPITSGNSSDFNSTYDPLRYCAVWRGPQTNNAYQLGGYQEPLGKYQKHPHWVELDSVSQPASINGTRKRRSTPPPLPEYYDLRNDLYCGDIAGIVRNQQSCGNCWAFAALGVIQDVSCLSSSGEFKHLLSASELHQCSDILNHPGSCVEGASPLDAIFWWRDHGLVSGSDNSENDHLGYGPGCYPYVYGPKLALEFPGKTDLQDNCVKDVCVSGFSKDQSQDLYGSDTKMMVGLVGSNFSFNENTWEWEIGAIDQQKVMRHIMRRGSVAMGFALYLDFLYYSSGVYVPSTHPDNISLGGHAVRVIGWGTSVTGGDYWTCVNSWGDSWGENGLFRIRRGENTAESEGYFFGFFYGCNEDRCSNKNGHCTLGNCVRHNSYGVHHHVDSKGPMNAGTPPGGSGVWSSWGVNGACSATCGTGIHMKTRSCDGGTNCIGESTNSTACSIKECIPEHTDITLSFEKEAYLGDKAYVMLPGKSRANDSVSTCESAFPGSIPALPLSAEEMNFVKTEFSGGFSYNGKIRHIAVRRCDYDNLIWCRRNGNGYDIPYDMALINWWTADGEPNAPNDYCLGFMAWDSTQDNFLKFKDSSCDSINDAHSGRKIICEKVMNPDANGVWSSWGAYGECSPTCGTAIKTRRRSCDGGTNCIGQSTETTACPVRECIPSSTDIEKGVYLGTKAYIMLQGQHKAQDANSACESAFPGSIAVIPMTVEEMDFIKAEFGAGSFSNNGRYRAIDIRRCDSDHLVWCRRNGNAYDIPYNMTLVDWQPNEPSTQTAYCAGFQVSSNSDLHLQFNDTGCTTLRKIICEK